MKYEKQDQQGSTVFTERRNPQTTQQIMTTDKDSSKTQEKQDGAQGNPRTG
jgi:hypothetical protein